MKELLLENLPYIAVAIVLLVIIRVSIRYFRKKTSSAQAKAADKLERIAHENGALPLIAVLQDPHEDHEVKSSAINALRKMQGDGAMASLVEALGYADQSASQLVADILIGFGDKALDTLLKTISSSKLEAQRYWGVYILGRIKNKKAIPALTAALTDHVGRVRAEAAKSLGNIGDEEAVPFLCRSLMEDPDPLVRDASAEALGIIADDRSLAALMVGLTDTDIETRRRSIQGLEKMGEKAIPYLLDPLKNGTPEIQAQAASALERIGAVSTAINNLEGPKDKEAFGILSLVAGAGVVDTIIQSLKDPRLKIRISLFRILEKAPTPKAYEALSDFAKNDKEWAGRLEALSALAKLANKQSIPLLASALQQEDETVREGLLKTLKEVPPSFLEDLSKPISDLLQDSNISIRIRAAELLSRLSPPSFAPIFLASLSDPIWEVRKIAAEALGKVKEDNTVKPLIAALKDPSIEVRVAAVKSLGDIKDPQSIEPLAQSFEWADDNSRNDIATALIGMVTNPIDFTDLLMGLTHPKARAGVVWTLSLISNEQTIHLMAKFLDDPDPTVRAVAAAALGRLGSFSSAVRFALMEGLKDPNEWVRASVVNVLGQHGDFSLVKTLITMLEEEPSEIVCQNLVLSIGSLADVVKQPFALPSINKWLEKSTDEKSQAAGLIALALLQDQSSFQKIFSAIQQPSLHLFMEKFLKDLSKEAQKRFFSFISLDPHLFWHSAGERSWEQYKHILQSSHDVEQRIHSIQALGLLKEKSALPLIESAFEKDPNPGVRGAALRAMEGLLDSKEMINKIAEAALDPSVEVRSCILPILRHLSQSPLMESREMLIPLLDSPEEEIRKPVSTLLAHLYRHDWRPLADQLMGTTQKYLIIGLIETLGEIGDPTTSQFFLQFIKHQDPEMRSVSAAVAGKMGALSRKDWIECLKDPQESVRLSALRALSKQLDSETLEILSSLLEDPSWQIRQEIAKLLGKQKIREEKRQVEILEHLSKDANARVQIVSLLSLFRLGKKGTGGPIDSIILKMPKKDLDSLLLDLQNEGVFVELVSTLRYGRESADRKEAIEILAALNLPHYAQELSRSLQDPASEVRLAAIEALEPCKDPSIQKAIEALSQDPASAVREAIKRRALEAR